MKLTKKSTMADVARCVASALESAGIRAVLTGGACASLYTRGRYESSDLDFIIQHAVSGMQLDRAMAVIGFTRAGNQYEHPDAGVKGGRFDRASPPSGPELDSSMERT